MIGRTKVRPCCSRARLQSGHPRPRAGGDAPLQPTFAQPIASYVKVRLSRDGRSRSDTILLAVLLLTACGAAYAFSGSQEAPQGQRSFNVTARKYAFAPLRLEVAQDDLVKVTMTSADIAHSFTIDAYRIDKRVGPKQSVTFEFRANQPGTFKIYCKLTQDSRCKEMYGELVVNKK